MCSNKTKKIDEKIQIIQLFSREFGGLPKAALARAAENRVVRFSHRLYYTSIYKSSPYRQDDLSLPLLLMRRVTFNINVMASLHLRRHLVKCAMPRGSLQKEVYVYYIMWECENKIEPLYIMIAMLGPRCCENWTGIHEKRRRHERWWRGAGYVRGKRRGKRVVARCARLHEGVSSNRRVSAACFNLTSLSASVPSGVARTLLASRLVQDTPVTRI